MNQNVVQFLPIFIDNDNIDEGAKKILKFIKPEWIAENYEKIKCKIFSDGLTNKLYGYYLENDKNKIIIIRIYGIKTELMIDRETEIENMKLLQNENLGPKLHATFQNGIVYDFVPGQTLDTVSCKNPIISNLVAAKFAQFHSIRLDGRENKSILWDYFNKINKLAEETLTKNESLISTFNKVGIKSGWGALAIEELKKIIIRQNMPLGFCHNDLLLGNIIYNEKLNQVNFIDFEYCFLNYIPYDIANHFGEFAGGTDTNFALCPDENFKIEWIKTYLKNYLNGKHSYDAEIFLKWINICLPLSLVFWILWGIVQANNSKIDFDFIEYVMVRIPEYEKLMENVRKMV